MAITVGTVTVRMRPEAARRYRRAGVILAVAVAAAWIAPYAMASGEDAAGVTNTWTVAEGETLWSIATEVTAAGGDVRDTMDAIKGLNALESSAITSGQQLLVPVG